MGGVDTFFVTDFTVDNETYHVTAVRVGSDAINCGRMLCWLKHNGDTYVLFGKISQNPAPAAPSPAASHEVVNPSLTPQDEYSNPLKFECHYDGLKVVFSAAEAVRIENELSFAIARALATLQAAAVGARNAVKSEGGPSSEIDSKAGVVHLLQAAAVGAGNAVNSEGGPSSEIDSKAGVVHLLQAAAVGAGNAVNSEGGPSSEIDSKAGVVHLLQAAAVGAGNAVNSEGGPSSEIDSKAGVVH